MNFRSFELAVSTGHFFATMMNQFYGAGIKRCQWQVEFFTERHRPKVIIPDTCSPGFDIEW